MLILEHVFLSISGQVSYSLSFHFIILVLYFDGSSPSYLSFECKKVKSQRWMLTHHSRVGGLRKAHACEKGFSPESSRNRRLGFMALTHLTSARCWRSNRQKLCDAFFCSSIWFRSFLGSVQGPFSDQHCCTVDLGVQPWPGAVPEVCLAIQARFHQCYQIASNFSISWLWSSVFSHEVGNICNFWYEDSMRGCERIQYDLYIYIQ